jgi:hypothetical protein
MNIPGAMDWNGRPSGLLRHAMMASIHPDYPPASAFQDLYDLLAVHLASRSLIE